MRLLITSLALLVISAPSAMAQAGGKAGGKKEGDRMARVLAKFDENGNGKLDPQEKEKLKKWRAENGKGAGRKGPGKGTGKPGKGRGRGKGKQGPGAGKAGKPDGKKKGTPPKGGRRGGKTPPLKKNGG